MNFADIFNVLMGETPTLRPSPRGTPACVLNGCKKELVLIPGSTRLAYDRKGKPILAKNKAGRLYHVSETYGVTKAQWKAMQNDQKRKAAGRWYSGAKVA